MPKLACAALASVHAPMSTHSFATIDLGSHIFEALPAEQNWQTPAFDQDANLIILWDAKGAGPTRPTSDETRAVTIRLNRWLKGRRSRRS